MSKMKKKSKYKMIVKTFIKFALIQLFLFIFILLSIQPYTAKTTKASIVVEATSYDIALKSIRFSVFADSEKYNFPSKNRWSYYFSNSELYESIKVGDKLTITYYESYSIFGKQKWVVDAYADDEIYRSIEDFNESKKSTIIFLSVFFVGIETVFIIFCIIYIKFNYNTLIKNKKRKQSDGLIKQSGDDSKPLKK